MLGSQWLNVGLRWCSRVFWACSERSTSTSIPIFRNTLISHSLCVTYIALFLLFAARIYKRTRNFFTLLRSKQQSPLFNFKRPKTRADGHEQTYRHGLSHVFFANIGFWTTWRITKHTIASKNPGATAPGLTDDNSRELEGRLTYHFSWKLSYKVRSFKTVFKFYWIYERWKQKNILLIFYAMHSSISH